MKRKLAKLLSGALILATVLSGCSSNNGNTSSGADTSPKTQDSTGNTDNSAAATGDAEHIVVTFVYATAEPKDLDKVQIAVNEMILPEINVEVEFRPISLADSISNYSLWISSGEQVDLMCLLGQDIRQYANSGQIEPLDAYISAEKTPNTWKLMQEFTIAGKVQDEIYGLSSVYPNYGTQPGVIFREEWLNEVDYEKKDIYTMDDLTVIFEVIKKNHPDCYPFSPVMNGFSSGGSTISAMIDLVPAGGNIIAGALTDENSAEVVNFFETDKYKFFLQQLAQWYEAGYIMPDVATTDLSGGELLKNGKIASYAMTQQPQMFGSEGYGFSLAGLPMAKPMMVGIDGIYWVVPITSKSPEAAMKFMDYLYGSSDLLNLILRGIENEHYIMVDKEQGFISYPDGIDANSTPYLNLFGVWGDRRYEYNYNHDVTHEANETFTNAAMEHKWKNYGFSFDSTPVMNQILSCQSVLDQYQKALETGSLGSKWEETYNTMLAGLETAGIEDVITECQNQLNAFLGK